MILFQNRLKFLLFFTVLLFEAGFCFAAEVRPAAVAGAFYPADSLELSRMVRTIFLHSKILTPGARPTGIISPHAGFVYSGPVAGVAYKQLQGLEYSTVVVIAPSHREYFEFASVFCGEAYSTPLGIVPVDRELAKKIIEAAGGSGLVRESERGHLQKNVSMGEHSLEVQLPFLQTVLGTFKLVPIVMSGRNPAICTTLASALAEAVGKRDDILLVASSDLSHFHSYDEANRLDSRLASYIEQYDYAGLGVALARGEVEACGGEPVMAVMQACRKLGAENVRIAARANSGDMSGEKDRVVGYLSALFYKKPSPEKEALNSSEDSGGPMELNAEERKYLLQLARKAIEKSVRGEKVPTPVAISPVMSENRGAFVTIKKNGALRGCIGYILAVKPLAETICEMAQAAALRDPRFSPVTENELDQLELEISVLTPIREVKDINSIEVGKDGLIIKQGHFQGLLLPQVPTEYGWDRETFLEQTCRKAGLPSDAWKDKHTEIASFRAEVFGEN